MIPVYNLSDFSPFYRKEQQFLIVPFQDLKRPQTFVWPHKHSFYEILWLREGETKHMVDDHEQDLSSDTIYFISPGQVHHLEKHGAVKGDSIMFTEEFFILNFTNKEALNKLSFLRNSYKNPHLKISAEIKTALEPIIQLMYAEFNRDDHSLLALSSLMFVLLNALERVYETQKHINYASGQAVLLDKFSQLVDENYLSQKNVSFYADALFSTPHHLNIVVKKASGKTVSEVIRDRIMLEAKRMLIHTDLPIGQIADQLGFNDFSYFSRHFKKYNGLTPDGYRTGMYEKYQFG